MTTNTNDDSEPVQHQKLASIESDTTFQKRLGELFLPLFNRLYGSDSDLVADVDQLLAQARKTTTAEMFLSRTLGYGVILGGVLWLLATAIAAIAFYGLGITVDFGVGLPVSNPAVLAIIEALKVPLIVLILGIVFGAIGFGAGFYGPRQWVSIQAGSNGREINTLLPDTVSYMYALSLGGLNQMEILEAVAESDDVYGEVSREFQSVLNETNYFDTDYRTALRHRAEETPSDELAQFITDMLSILSSGGDLQSFLDNKTDKHLREAEKRQQDLIEMIELFGEMYLNVSLLPLLMIILLTVMKLMGSSGAFMMNLVIYLLIPIIGVAFVVLMSTILPDEPGDGVLYVDGEAPNAGSTFLDTTVAKKRKGLSPRFDYIYNTELRNKLRAALSAPHEFFIDNPQYTFAITGPISLIIVIAGAVTGIAPTSWKGMVSGLWGTVYYVYIPLYLLVVPHYIFRRFYNKRIADVTDNYTEALRKLSSANDTGQTILESFLTVADTTSGKLGDEFRAINAKVDYNYSLKEALVEFNNKYQIPEVARINNLIIDAQETSTKISDVLTTAAQTSENQDRIERERASRTRMQVVMIMMTFFVLMGVIAMLQNQFITVMGEMTSQISKKSSGSMGGGMSFSAINPTKTGIKFFHAVTLQALTAGFLASYLSNNTLRDAGKYILIMATPTLLVWMLLMG